MYNIFIHICRYQPIFKVLQDVSKGTPLESLDMTVPGLTQLRADTVVMDEYEKACKKSQI